MPALLRQPSSALLCHEHTQAENSARNQLETNGNLPLRGVVVRNVLCDSIVNPVRGHDTQGEEELEHGAQHATDVLGSHLGRVHGDNDGCHSHANTTDDAGGVEGAKRVGLQCLDDGPDTEDGGGEDEGPSATKLGRERPDEETSKEGCSPR